MCPFNTVTEPNHAFKRSASACPMRCHPVPHPHTSDRPPTLVCARTLTTIGVLLASETFCTSRFSQSSCSAAQRAESAGLEVHHVHETNEVDPAVVETIVALRSFVSVAREILCAIVGEHVMFAPGT